MLKKVLYKFCVFGLWWVGFLSGLGAFLVVFIVISLLIRIVIKSIFLGDLCRMLCDVFPIQKCQENSAQKRANICGRGLVANIGWVVSAGTGRGFVITCHPTHVKESSKL
jgi:hypothetical protein